MDGSDFSHRAKRPLDGLVRDAGLRAAIGYWDSLRTGQLVPPRTALDHGALRPVLQSAAILENPRAGTVRVRLAGARINALMGMEARGMPLRALFDLADRGRVTAEAENALAEPAVLLMDVVTPAPRHGVAPRLATQIALLPLCDAEFMVNRALYVMGDVDGAEPGALQPDIPHRWSLWRTERIALRADESVLSVEAARTGPPTGAHPAATDEAASERRGPLARARFRVIDGGLA